MTKRVKPISLLCWVLAICVATSAAWADSVVMQNGDHYNGKVLSVSTNILVLQSDVLGTVNLPRAKVASLTFGTNGAPASASATAALPPIRLASFPQTNAATA